MENINLLSDPESIYVVDAQNVPLMVMPVAQIHAQKLWHRGVVVLASDSLGRLGLRQKKQLGLSNWDVLGSGHVGSDEAHECAVERLLPPELKGHGLAFSLRHTQNFGLGTGKEFIQIFEIRLPDQLRDLLSTKHKFMFVDQDEFSALVSNFPDQLSADLLTIWTARLHCFAPQI